MNVYIINIDYEKRTPRCNSSIHTTQLITRAGSFKEAQEKASNYLLSYLRRKNPQNTYHITAILSANAITGCIAADFLVL